LALDGGSDITSNAFRGALAEYIVALALVINYQIRNDWNPYDLETPDGLRIEVKSSAYIKSWKQKTISRISFDIKPTRSWDASTNELGTVSLRESDVYVLDLSHEIIEPAG
jgi:hypothetical protein